MTDALAVGEKLLALLEESARTTTYKPALLLALIDRAQEYSERESIPVRALAERVIELYWPQTLAYPTTGHVLKQSQTSTGRAAIVQAILAFRGAHAAASRALPPAIRNEPEWEHLLTRVEESLAEWPIPRLQRPTSHSSMASTGAGPRPAVGLCALTARPAERSGCTPASAMR